MFTQNGSLHEDTEYAATPVLSGVNEHALGCCELTIFDSLRMEDVRYA